MIIVHKIGLDYYYKNNEQIDKNSGYFEYRCILNELSQLETSNSTKMLIIINGKLAAKEEKWLLKYMTNFDKLVFIMSDIIALSDNKQIIEKCDYLLHQCPNRTFDKFPNCRQMYSYVPELFYKYIPKWDNCGKDILVFGGGMRGNDEKINNYLALVPSTSFVKTETKDTRIPYADYLDILRNHAYSLIISRKEYADIGWVTARFVEAIANNCLPIVDATYDSDNYFGIDKISNTSELQKAIDFYNTFTNTRQAVIDKYKAIFEKSSNYFYDLIGVIYYGTHCE